MHNTNARRPGLPGIRITSCLLLLPCLAASAQEPDAPGLAHPTSTPVEVEVFKGPQMRGKAVGLRYPDSESSRGHEGWVRLDMMIDSQGKPYEVVVAESTGNEAFEYVAVRAAQNWKFDPATRDGTAIHGSFSLKVGFYMRDPAKGAAPKFVGAYRDLMKAIEAGDQARADGQLAKLEARNLYEDAYKNLASYHYHRKWGTQEQQLAALRGAIAGESVPRYLPSDTFAGVLASLLGLEVRMQDYGSALKTWERLQPIAPRESLPAWQKTIDQIQALRSGDGTVRLAGAINRGTSWNGQLFKNRFEIALSSGQVSEIKLRCEKQYLFFPYEPGVRYTVETRGGSCSIELVGDPGTKFELVQS